MSWALRDIPGAEQLIEYESRLNTLTARHPLCALCQYDLRLFRRSQLDAVVRVHPWIIIQGQMMRSPWYDPGYRRHAQFAAE